MGRSQRHPSSFAAILRAVRDAWLVLGVTVAMFLALEFAYRLGTSLHQLVGKNPEATSAPRLDPSHPYADSAWFPEFLRERKELSFSWRPFVYGRARPQRGRYINIDSAGLRMVPRYRVPGGIPFRLFELGGSTTWGYFDRDSSTRPAVEARLLARAGYDAEVTSFGQLGYVGVQELLTLVLELRRGNVPNAVVFWDGVNDINAAAVNRRPGVSYREFERDSDATFNYLRRTNGMRVADRLAVRSLAWHSRIVRRLLQLFERSPPSPPIPEPVQFCRAVMADWVAQARLVDQLADAYGFTALMIWQPQWQTAGRPRSRFERLPSTPGLVSPEIGLDLHRRECARLADSLVAVKAARSIVNLASLHHDDTATVFLDAFSHTTERTTAQEADTVVALLLARLGKRRRSETR